MNKFLRKDYEKTRKLPAPKALIKLIGWLFPFSVPGKIRPWLLRLAGARVGSHIYIGRMCVIDDNFTELLTIEDDVVISYGVMIFCHDRSKPETVLGPVTLKKGCFLGFGCLIMPGVTVGEKAVVGAGAVVTKDVPAGTTVLGVPAVPVK